MVAPLSKKREIWIEMVTLNATPPIDYFGHPYFPKELILNIFSSLNLFELARMSMMNRRLYKMIHEKTFWEKCIEETFTKVTGTFLQHDNCKNNLSKLSLYEEGDILRIHENYIHYSHRYDFIDFGIFRRSYDLSHMLSLNIDPIDHTLFTYFVMQKSYLIKQKPNLSYLFYSVMGYAPVIRALKNLERYLQKRAQQYTVNQVRNVIEKYSLPNCSTWNMSPLSWMQKKE